MKQCWGFNHKGTAFEQLREMGLELTVSVGLCSGRGQGTYFFIGTDRKKRVYRFSHASGIAVMPVPAASVLPGANNYIMHFQISCRHTLLDFVQRAEWILILFCFVVGSKFSLWKVFDISDFFAQFFFHQKQKKNQIPWPPSPFLNSATLWTPYRTD